MSYPKGLHPGATWKKCDFQIHTPRDPQWDGQRFAGGRADLEAAREAWADIFVTECIQRGLGAIAVTDHHDFCFVPYVQRAAQRVNGESQSLWVFPGTEVTCNDAAQCLVLFDVGTNSAVWERLFGGHLPAVAVAACESERLPQAILCGKDIPEFVKGVAGDAVLGKFAICLAHASDEGAHKSMMRQGFHERFKHLPVDGVYTDKPFANLEGKIVQRIHGTIAEWGTRRRGIIPTSDSRSHTFEALGQNSCWVKLGEPTVEGIRQALLADEARIAYTTPSIPSQRVLELRVDSTLCGPDFRLMVNDGFTAIIGGRGSGKSAVLEYLRFGLGRSTSEVMPDLPSEYQRQKNLITETLASGNVTVKLERDGVTETWHRSGARRDVITVTVSGTPAEEISIQAAQQRFRARAFSQKQLSSLVASATDTAEQITGIAAAEEIDQRQSIDLEITRAKRDVDSSLQRVVEFWVAESEHNGASSAVKDLRRRIDASKKKLEESGLTAQNQKVLEEAPVYSSTRTFLKEVGLSLSSDLNVLQHTVTSLPSIDLVRLAKAVNFEEIKQFSAQVENARQSIQSNLDSVRATLEQLENARLAAEQQFNLRFTEFEGRHTAAVAQQANLRTLIAESQKLNAELEDAEGRERKSTSRLTQLQGAWDALRAARSVVNEQLALNRALLGKAALKVSSMSDGMLRAEVRSESIPRQFLESLTDLCESHRVRDSHARCENRLRDMLNAESGENWSGFCDRFIELLKIRIQAGGPAPEPSEHVSQEVQKLLFELTVQQVNGMYASLNAKKVGAFLVATPVDYISFEYRDRDRYIPFQQASEGQQAAALLHLLLRQEAGTLIIDQPEDDLDNKVIMEIVRLVQTAKQKRQLIFTTHNANFVVNGDADKVVALAPGANDPNAAALQMPNSPRIQIDVDGAIETPQVRTTITDTVEGGKKAFELRSRKYQFGIQ